MGRPVQALVGRETAAPGQPPPLKIAPTVQESIIRKRPMLNPVRILAAWLVAACIFASASQTHPQKTASTSQPNPRVQVANVLFRYSPDLSILVVRLQGTLVPTPGHTVPSFNQPASFLIATDAAEIRMSTDQLAGLMNSWLLASPKAQIKNVRISIAANQLVIDGTMKKGLRIPFHATADLAITKDNRIRINLLQVKVAHLPVKGFLATLGLNLDDLVSQKGLKGMSVDGDSFLIDPQSAFPSPQIRAALTRVQLTGQGIVLSFGAGAPNLANPPARNYIAIRGGSIRYGREEMSNADLTMIDSTPADPFEFYFPRYWCQMVAGEIKVTPSQALRIRVPDFAKLPPGSCRP